VRVSAIPYAPELHRGPALVLTVCLAKIVSGNQKVSQEEDQSSAKAESSGRKDRKVGACHHHYESKGYVQPERRLTSGSTQRPVCADPGSGSFYRLGFGAHQVASNSVSRLSALLTLWDGHWFSCIKDD
jgi:hypothetical protein